MCGNCGNNAAAVEKEPLYCHHQCCSLHHSNSTMHHLTRLRLPPLKCIHTTTKKTSPVLPFFLAPYSTQVVEREREKKKVSDFFAHWKIFFHPTLSPSFQENLDNRISFFFLLPFPTLRPREVFYRAHLNPSKPCALGLLLCLLLLPPLDPSVISLTLVVL